MLITAATDAYVAMRVGEMSEMRSKDEIDFRIHQYDVLMVFQHRDCELSLIYHQCGGLDQHVDIENDHLCSHEIPVDGHADA